jgi:hypothetical protein
MLVHRGYLAQLQSQLKTLLKLQLFLRVLENVLVRNQIVKVRAIPIQTSSVLKEKAAVFCPPE